MKKTLKFTFLFLIVFAVSFFSLNIDIVDAKQISDPIVTTTPPSSYDLRDYIYINVEDQNPYGTCYAYASLTSLETYLALNYNEYYDFSEVHFALSLYLQSGYYNSVNEVLNSGGNFNHFITYSQKYNSIVLEEEMPMSKYSNLSGSTKYSAMESDFNKINSNFYPIVKVNDTKTFPQYAGDKSQYTSSELASFRNDVKSHIMEYGSLTAGIHVNSSEFTSKSINLKVTDASLVSNQNAIISNINHLISIIGWDDDYDANGAWENKGAYLCLNSWGEDAGNNGCFYISYDDYFVETLIQGICNASLSTTNNKISTFSNHPENTFITSHTISNSNIYFANIIDTSNYIGESIQYIDTFAKGETTKFYIKFFNSKISALNGLNSVTVMNIANSSHVGEFSLYNKYQLSSPLQITNNFMVIVTSVKSVYKTHSLGGYATKVTNLEPTYYTTLQLGEFSTDKNWNHALNTSTLNLTLPLILHTNSKHVQTSAFSIDMENFIDSKYIKNNSIVYNKTINLSLYNTTISEEILNKVKITKLYSNSFLDVSSNFEISNNLNTISIKMINNINGSFQAGEYIVSIPCNGTTIYRILEVQEAVSYSITYYLNGGEATNPNSFTNKHTSLSLNNPTKPGFTFAGWFTDSNLTIPFDANNLTYTNLNLYAKYDFATPIITSKTKDISITYYDNLKQDISIIATHHFLNEFNTLSYQWYMRKNLNDEFTIIQGATSNILSLYNVSDSGYYACEVSITITDESLTDATCIKTLQVSSNNQIVVNIKPYVYDTSNTQWDYSTPISYDTTTHTVELINIPQGVNVIYSQNEFSDIGTYTAHAEFVYDDKNGNAIAPAVEDLTWQIRKAKITITIDDILTKEALSNQSLTSLYSCTIAHEYLPEDIISHQDKINYLELVYQLIDTPQPCVKIITATTKTFDIYEIVIVNGKYEIVINWLYDNNISSTSTDGFVRDCIFTAQLNNDINVDELLNKQNLKFISAYDISYSYLQSDNIATINIPVERDLLFNNLSVYMLKDNKLIKVDNLNISTDGISFTTREQNANYIIATDNLKHNSNTEILFVTCIITVYVILIIYSIILTIRRKKDYFI